MSKLTWAAVASAQPCGVRTKTEPAVDSSPDADFGPPRLLPLPHPTFPQAHG
jgi:hypothetical protein